MVWHIVQPFKKYTQIKKNYLEKNGKYDIIMLCKKHTGGIQENGKGCFRDR